MSASVDRRRKQDRRDEALDRAKVTLRLLQSVTTHFAAGLSARETAERLDLCERTVRKHWSTLGLSTRRGRVGKAAESAPVAVENSSVSAP